MNRTGALARAVAILGAIVGLDQAVKALVVSRIAYGKSVHAIFGVEIVNVHNRGIAFGLFPGRSWPILVGTAIVVVGVFAWLTARFATPGLWLACGLLGGGAIGNMLDRVRLGYVVDFIDISVWPAFNVADIAVVAGVAVLVYSLEARTKPSDTSAETLRDG